MIINRSYIENITESSDDIPNKYNSFMSKNASKIKKIVSKYNEGSLKDRIKHKPIISQSRTCYIEGEECYAYEFLFVDMKDVKFVDKIKIKHSLNKMFSELYDELVEDSIKSTLSLINQEEKDGFKGYIYFLIKGFGESSTEVRKTEKIDLTKYFAFNPEDGMEPSLVGDAEEVFYKHPVYNKAIMEHFDLLDLKTRRTLHSMNEAGQNTVLMNLTSKLYDKIVEKCDDIDYGEIPKTKGDIRKLPKYESMKECIALMHDILKEYNQDTGPVDELSVAFANIESRKDLFERAYRYNAELPIAMYCNVTLGIITGISYMIATCIEFIKDPGAENFRIALDKMAYAKTKDHLIYNTLKSFNKSCATKEFDRAMEAILKASTKNFAAGAVLGGIAISVLGIILVLIPVLRELIFLFYYTRVKISDFFDIQADLLQMNAYSIEANTTLSPTERKKVMAKQLKYVEQFRKISNSVAIEVKKAEVASDKEKKSDDETKMLIDDIGGIDPGTKSALF